MNDPYYKNYGPYEFYKNSPQKNESLIRSKNSNTPINQQVYWGIPSSDFPYIATIPGSIESMVCDLPSDNMDITDRIIKDKISLLGTTARILRHQIDERNKMYADNIRYIDYKIIKCECYLLNIDGFPPFINKMIEGQRTNLSNEIAHLETEKRKEIVNNWGDKVKLYADLIQTLGEYQNAIRRAKIISGD